MATRAPDVAKNQKPQANLGPLLKKISYLSKTTKSESTQTSDLNQKNLNNYSQKLKMILIQQKI